MGKAKGNISTDELIYVLALTRTVKMQPADVNNTRKLSGLCRFHPVVKTWKAEEVSLCHH